MEKTALLETLLPLLLLGGGGALLGNHFSKGKLFEKFQSMVDPEKYNAGILSKIEQLENQFKTLGDNKMGLVDDYVKSQRNTATASNLEQTAGVGALGAMGANAMAKSKLLSKFPSISKATGVAKNLLGPTARVAGGGFGAMIGYDSGKALARDYSNMPKLNGNHVSFANIWDKKVPLSTGNRVLGSALLPFSRAVSAIPESIRQPVMGVASAIPHTFALAASGGATAAIPAAAKILPKAISMGSKAVAPIVGLHDYMIQSKINDSNNQRFAIEDINKVTAQQQPIIQNYINLNNKLVPTPKR